jgi:hypothetical protein
MYFIKTQLRICLFFSLRIILYSNVNFETQEILKESLLLYFKFFSK